MKVSMRVDYGVRAMVDLAQHYGQGTVQSSEIAARQGIPDPYLNQLLGALRKAGLIHSRRGPGGGHFLVKEPSQVKLIEVIAALEGSTAPIACLEKPGSCPHSPSCAQRDVWQLVDEATKKVLDVTTIAEVAYQQARRRGGGMYFI